MGEFKIYLKKKTLNFYIFRMSWILNFLKKPWNKKKYLLKNKKICEAEKKSKYGRHQISRPMLIEAPITTENYFWGGRTDGRADILRKWGGSHVMLERGNLAGSSGGTRNSHKKFQLLGVNFDQFMAILVFKKIIKKKTILEIWNFAGSLGHKRTSHQK